MKGKLLLYHWKWINSRRFIYIIMHDYTKELQNFSELPHKKAYEIKIDTKQIINYNEIEWVSDLIDRTHITVDVLVIMEIFLNFIENDIPSSVEQEKFWEFTKNYLTSKLDNISTLFYNFLNKFDR